MGAVDKLNWGVRLGFGAGDLAQNLVLATVGTYLLFFCTDVVGLAPSAVATMFLVVQLADALWNLFAGVLVDRHHPPWGKYRSYLLLAGIPFALFAVLCFANPLGNAGGAWKTLYACTAYAGFTLLFTLVNVAYGALSASLTRDTDEITTLTAVRIFLANAGSLVAMAGVPLLVAALGGADGGGTPSLPGADGEWGGGRGATALPWRMALFMGCGMLPSFVFMPLLPALRRALGKKGLFYVFGAVALVGMAALYVLSRVGRIEDHVGWGYAAQFVKATGIIVATGYMWALVPEVIEYSERLAGRRVSGVITAIVGVFFRVGLALGNVAAGLVLSWTDYRAAQGGTRSVASADILPTDPRAWLWTMLALAAVAVVLLVFSFTQTKERVVMKAADAAQVRVADLWREFRLNGPLRWLALFFVAAFALMSVGNAAGAYFMNGLESQVPLAQEGIRWLVCVVPALLMAVAAFAISRYRA